MFETALDSLLKELAPVSSLKEVNSSKSKKKLRNKRLLLNDTINTSINERHFANGCLKEPMNRMTTEELSKRYIQGLENLEADNVTNISNFGYWKPSSSKQNFEIKNALNDKLEDFWQSDGVQPHYVDVYFSKGVEIKKIAIFLSTIADESYTPRLINIYAGHSESDLCFYKTLMIESVNGWVGLTFEDNREWDHLLKCQFLRFTFPVNHENGKDTHLRGIRIYSPSIQTTASRYDTAFGGNLMPYHYRMDPFETELR